MFEHYLQHQIPDRRRRWRVALAVNVAGFATAGLVGFTWLMDKMMIAQVAPPTAQFVMVQMAMESLAPPPPPPAAPALRPEPEPEDERVIDDDPLTPPDSFVERLPPASKPRVARVLGTGAPDSKGTLPFGGPPGLTGLIGSVPGGLPRDPGVATRQDSRPAATRAPLPIAAVRAQALYTPAPDQHKLGATRAALLDRRAGENETSFCVDTDGRTTDVRTTRRFPGDPEVDEICRATVRTWRFKPFLVDGRPTRTCSVQVFNITFQR